ncbi:MAG: hypothetical protein IH999_09000 [Proteobacteria bacterium]|nr:hypothetical protein [Pseudomonadota bacterium]
MNMKQCSAAIAAALLLGAAGAAAGEKGTYESVYAWTKTYQTVEQGHGRSATAGYAPGTRTITKGNGLFPEGSVLIAECVIYVEQGPEGINLKAPCVYTDVESGDKIFSVHVRISDQLAEGGGREKLTGGTGKYEGLTGECTYHVTYLPGDQGVQQNRCEWEVK